MRIPKLFLIALAIILFLALLLALKNPFDTQSLIPNLEPYPDSLYYMFPAWNFVHGGSFAMHYADLTVKNATPPLYTLYLLPFFALFQDVRTFFFGNIALLIFACTLMSYLLYLVVKPRNVADYMVLTFSGAIFATNFYVYTMPSLPMAELISLVGFLVMLILLAHPKKSPLSVYAAMLMLLVKFSNAPVVLVFVISYALRLKGNLKGYAKHGAFASGLLAFFLLSSGILAGHKNLQPGASFSITYFLENFHFYLSALFGGQTHYLWFDEKLVSPLVALCALFGGMIGLWRRESKIFSIQILLLTLALVLFMSTFITPDARYVSMLLPIYSVFMCFFLMWLSKHMKTPVIIALLSAVYLFTPFSGYRAESVAQTLKKQVGLNYLHPENPWNYIALQEFQKYIDEHPSEKPTYLGTFLPPFYVAFYAKNYTALPLTAHQEFYSPADADRVLAHYDELLQTSDVYVTNAYSGNARDIWPAAFEKMLARYNGTLVKEACLGTCNIYKLHPSILPVALRK